MQLQLEVVKAKFLYTTAIYSENDILFELFPTEDVEVLGDIVSLRPMELQISNDHCSDQGIVRSAWQFHGWGAYQVKVTVREPRGPFWLGAYLLEW